MRNEQKDNKKRTEREKMLAGELYDAQDPELRAARQRAQRLARLYNATTEEEAEQRARILREALGGCGAAIHIEPFFRFDYGCNIYLGDNFYANFDCIMLDPCEIRIGRNCMLAPRVSICTATHPTEAAVRVAGTEFAAPIVIGDDVWIGAHAVVNPGVTIGDRVVVASGAVVTRDLPDDVVAAGVPARIVRRL